MKTIEELQLIAKEVKPDNVAEFIGYLKAMKIEHDKKEAELAAAKYTPEMADKTISQARARCYTKSNAQYETYGGAGVDISLEFQDKDIFRAYLMGLDGYGEIGHRIDRLNLSKGYERDNIRWALKADCNELTHNFPGKTKDGYVFYVPGTNLEFSTNDFEAGLDWLNLNFLKK